MIDECTLLFDAFDIENPERVNTYILDAFAGKYDRVIAKNLEKYISRANVVDMLVFDRSDYDKSLNLNSKKKVNFSSKFESSILENLVSFQSGLWKGEKWPLQMVKVLRNTNFNLNNWKLSYEDIAEIEVESKQLESRKLDYGDIILEKSGGSDTQAIWRVALFDKRSNELFSYSNFCSRIRVIDPGQAHPLYIAHILNDFYNKWGTVPLQNWVRLLNIDMEGYKKIKIPLPPLNIQQQIVDEMEILEQRERENKENVERFKNSIGLLLPKNIASIKVDDIALMLKRGKSPKYGDSHIQIIKSWQARGVRTFDFAERHFVDASFVLDERKIEKWDILINSTGVGTAGRVTLFDLDGDFVVDTHITILRLDRSRAIPIYILSYFVDFGFKNIEALALGQSGQIELSIETIKNLKIPLPPLSEQQRIVMEIEQIEGKIAELELELASIPAQKEAILKKYL